MDELKVKYDIVQYVTRHASFGPVSDYEWASMALEAADILKCKAITIDHCKLIVAHCVNYGCLLALLAAGHAVALELNELQIKLGK